MPDHERYLREAIADMDKNRVRFCFFGDLSRLSPPDVVERLDYETILGAMRAELLARAPTLANEVLRAAGAVMVARLRANLAQRVAVA